MSSSYINSDTNPTSVTGFPFLYESNPEQEAKNEFPQGEMGKWMMFIELALLNEKWAEARRLYNEGKLAGIHSMKVSTAFDNSRASDKTKGIIIFYCGPMSHEEMMMDVGRQLLVRIPYYDPFGRGFIYYKSDEQTAQGTRATGNRRNHLYKIAVPREPDGSVESDFE